MRSGWSRSLSASATARKPSMRAHSRRPSGRRDRGGRGDDRAGWLRRMMVAVPLATVVVVLTYAEPHDVTAAGSWRRSRVPIQFWCGLPFLRGAWVRARARTTNMDTLIALATLTAFIYATVELLTAPERPHPRRAGRRVQRPPALRHLGGDHRLPLHRALVRGDRARPGRARCAGADDARCAAGASARPVRPRRGRATRAGRGRCALVISSWCVRATRSRSTASWCRAPRRSTSRC